MTDVNRTVGGVTFMWRGDAVTKTMRKELAGRVSKSAVFLQKQIVKNISTPSRTGGPSLAGGFPRTNTGALRKSIFIRKSENGLSAFVGTVSKVAFFMEFGAIIRPKKAKALAIPISRKAKKHSDAGGSARDFPIKLVFIRRKGKPPLLVEITGKGGGKLRKKWTIHYVLPAMARLAPRPFLLPTLNQMKDEILEILSAPMFKR